MAVRVAVNGFGRTGRAAVRAINDHGGDVELVAVNDLADPVALARLLRNDSVHGRFPGDVVVEDRIVTIAGRAVEFLAEPDAHALPWKELDVDVVIESTGRLTSGERAGAHLSAGARRVVISAPAKEVDATFVMGVNDHTFDPMRHFVVSNASCTTNCLAMLVKVLQDAFGIEDAFMTTVHAYTGDQRLVDALHKDPRRGRAAACNIVPTTTGAARATGDVLPSVAGLIDGLAIRVPVADGSLVDLVANLDRTVNLDDVHAAFAEASAGDLSGYLECSAEPLVSTDIIGSPASCIYDSDLTMSHAKLVKVFGWYDNETGYSSRLVDLAALVGSRY